MKKYTFVVTIFISAASYAASPANWALEQSTIKYFAAHSFHNTVGVTKSAKGKGMCDKGDCEFLVAAEVKSFDSGDSNRDQHMIQAVNGGNFPMVSVKTKVKETSLKSDFSADLTVNFGGKEVVYPAVAFHVLESTADQLHFTGEIPLKLEKHAVKRPSLLGVKIKDDAPVNVDIVWKRQ